VLGPTKDRGVRFKSVQRFEGTQRALLKVNFFDLLQFLDLHRLFSIENEMDFALKVK
jgi:hypothetical protein